MKKKQVNEVVSIKRYIKSVKSKLKVAKVVRKHRPAILLIRFKAGEEAYKVRNFLSEIRNRGGRKVSAHFLRQAVFEAIEKVKAL